jgi:hypothetical protein
VEIPATLSTQELGGDFTLHIGFVKDPDCLWIGLYDNPSGGDEFNPTGY